MNRTDLLRHADAVQLLQPHMEIDASHWLQDGRRLAPRYPLKVPTPPAYRHRPNGHVSYQFGDVLDTIEALNRVFGAHRTLRTVGTPAPLAWDASGPTITAEVIAGKPGIRLDYEGHTLRLKGGDAKALAYEIADALIAAKNATTVVPMTSLV